MFPSLSELHFLTFLNTQIDNRRFRKWRESTLYWQAHPQRCSHKERWNILRQESAHGQQQQAYKTSSRSSRAAQPQQVSTLIHPLPFIRHLLHSDFLSIIWETAIDKFSLLALLLKPRLGHLEPTTAYLLSPTIKRTESHTSPLKGVVTTNAIFLTTISLKCMSCDESKRHLGLCFCLRQEIDHYI